MGKKRMREGTIKNGEGRKEQRGKKTELAIHHQCTMACLEILSLEWRSEVSRGDLTEQAPQRIIRKRVNLAYSK